MENKGKKTKIKKWSYATSLSYKDKNGTERSMLSQLYQIGVYVILDGDSNKQFSVTPSKMVKVQRQIQKDKEITELKIGLVITVMEENGFYKQLKNE